MSQNAVILRNNDLSWKRLDDFVFSDKLLQNQGSIYGYYNKFQVFICMDNIILTEAIGNGEMIAASDKLSRINNINGSWSKTVGSIEGAGQLMGINIDYYNWVVGWMSWPVNIQLFGTAIFSIG